MVSYLDRLPPGWEVRLRAGPRGGWDLVVYIPKGATHRLFNPGDEPVHLIEVQFGDYLGEDDIVRLDDVYGRVDALPAAAE